MQNYINVETFPAKIIAENPSLQKNVQENGAKLRKVFNNDLLKLLEKVLEDY